MASRKQGYRTLLLIDRGHVADGIWGKVEWTETGTALMADRAYRGISPVMVHDATGKVTAILRASLTNRPNLKGLATLHGELDMEPLAELRTLLG